MLRRSGSLVTSSSRDLTTVIRDPRTGRAVRRFAFGGRPETLTADGSQMAFQARKGSVRFADLETGSLRTVTGGRKEITSLQFTPDRYRLLIGDADGRIALWDLRRDAPVEEFEGHGGGVNDVAVTRSGATAYSASADGNLIAWISPARDDSPGTFVFCNPQTSCPSEPSRSTLTVPEFALPAHGGFVDVYESAPLRRTRRLRVTRKGPPASLAVDWSSHKLAASIDDGSVGVWTFATGTPPMRPQAGGAVALAGARTDAGSRPVTAQGLCNSGTHGSERKSRCSAHSGNRCGRRLRSKRQVAGR